MVIQKTSLLSTSFNYVIGTLVHIILSFEVLRFPGIISYQMYLPILKSIYLPIKRNLFFLSLTSCLTQELKVFEPEI